MSGWIPALIAFPIIILLLALSFPLCYLLMQRYGGRNRSDEPSRHGHKGKGNNLQEWAPAELLRSHRSSFRGGDAQDHDSFYEAQLEDGNWQRIDRSAEIKIRDEDEKGTQLIKYEHRGTTYEADMNSNTQVNMETGAVNMLRRNPGTSWEISTSTGVWERLPKHAIDIIAGSMREEKTLCEYTYNGRRYQANLYTMRVVDVVTGQYQSLRVTGIPEKQWESLEDVGLWEKLPPLACRALDSALFAGKKICEYGAGACRYQVDFTTMQRTNLATDESTRIRINDGGFNQEMSRTSGVFSEMTGSAASFSERQTVNVYSASSFSSAGFDERHEYPARSKRARPSMLNSLTPGGGGSARNLSPYSSSRAQPGKSLSVNHFPLPPTDSILNDIFEPKMIISPGHQKNPRANVTRRSSSDAWDRIPKRPISKSVLEESSYSGETGSEEQLPTGSWQPLAVSEGSAVPVVASDRPMVSQDRPWLRSVRDSRNGSASRSVSPSPSHARKGALGPPLLTSGQALPQA